MVISIAFFFPVFFFSALYLSSFTSFPLIMVLCICEKRWHFSLFSKLTICSVLGICFGSSPHLSYIIVLLFLLGIFGFKPIPKTQFSKAKKFPCILESDSSFIMHLCLFPLIHGDIKCNPNI